MYPDDTASVVLTQYSPTTEYRRKAISRDLRASVWMMTYGHCYYCGNPTNPWWTFTVDREFLGVMRACAQPSADRPSTWITPDFERSYCELHRRGLAHSIEVWNGDDLVGGLYGVTMGGFFGGESMFHRATDASKAAVGFLIERLRAGGFSLCDGQVPTPHLARLGAINISRDDYLGRLRRALANTARLTSS